MGKGLSETMQNLKHIQKRDISTKGMFCAASGLFDNVK